MCVSRLLLLFIVVVVVGICCHIIAVLSLQASTFLGPARIDNDLYTFLALRRNRIYVLSLCERGWVHAGGLSLYSVVGSRPRRVPAESIRMYGDMKSLYFVDMYVVNTHLLVVLREIARSLGVRGLFPRKIFRPRAMYTFVLLDVAADDCLVQGGFRDDSSSCLMFSVGVG